MGLILFWLKCCTCEILFLLLWFRELKHRSVKDPSETFKLQDYVNKEMKSSGCCRAWTLHWSHCGSLCVCGCSWSVFRCQLWRGIELLVFLFLLSHPPPCIIVPWWIFTSSLLHPLPTISECNPRTPSPITGHFVHNCSRMIINGIVQLQHLAGPLRSHMQLSGNIRIRLDHVWECVTGGFCVDEPTYFGCFMSKCMKMAPCSQVSSPASTETKHCHNSAMDVWKHVNISMLLMHKRHESGTAWITNLHLGGSFWY